MKWVWTILTWIGKRFGSGPDYRADFESVAGSWQKLSERMETQLAIVSGKLEVVSRKERILSVAMVEMRVSLKECLANHEICLKRAAAQDSQILHLTKTVEHLTNIVERQWKPKEGGAK